MTEKIFHRKLIFNRTNMKLHQKIHMQNAMEMLANTFTSINGCKKEIDIKVFPLRIKW